MRLQLSNPDWAILIGTALMVFSGLGWYMETPRPEPERPASQAMQSVPTLPAKLVMPVAATGTAAPLNTARAGADSFLVPVDAYPAQADAADSPADAPAAPTVAARTPPTASAQPPKLAGPTPSPEMAAPQDVRRVPDRIEIPAIGLDAPVFPSSYTLVRVDGQTFQQWEAPNGYAAGWQTSSVGLGTPGNTVLLGHNNINGEVFAHLVDLNEGDTIQIYAGETRIEYRVEQKMILPEKEQDLSVRLENASWLLPSEDERLTLVTCWPQSSNTHRLIIVAKP